MYNKVNAHQFIFKIFFFLIYTCILIYIHDIVWMLKGTTLIIDPNFITPTLNGESPKQREELTCSTIMISENTTPRNSQRNES